MSRYTIGVDFGTLSGRALVVDVTTGQEMGSVAVDYAHGVMDETLPCGLKLEPDWALQHPQDYLDVLVQAIPEVLRNTGISPDDVIGLGIDFTACTMLPISADGQPLCFQEKWERNPHSWIKLWKHHAAQPEANRINEIAEQRGEQWLPRYGGKISSEWFLAKAWQILDEAPEIYAAADRLLEAADWVVLQLTGVEARNACTAGYKALWSKQEGYPSNDYFAALDPRLADLVDSKMSRDIYPIGAKAGDLTEAMASQIGLRPGIAVAVANVDAHVAVPAATVVEPGRMVMIMGTSTCHMVCGTESKIVPGMCGVVEDGILPNLFGFEAGQSAVGDIFAWFIENCVPQSYHREAEQKGISIHELLTSKADALKPGESGLLALDWWNGNRSVLVDTDLTGLLLGCTLTTKPEEIYRALIEATAYGTAKIIKTFEENGVPVREIVACGGLPNKNRVLMQIYSDVTGREFKIASSAQTPALGSAMFGAVAAGAAAGGYDTIMDAATKMAGVRDEVFQPIAENQRIYARLFAEYEKLHDYFGRNGNPVMKTLKEIKLAQTLS